MKERNGALLRMLHNGPIASKSFSILPESLPPFIQHQQQTQFQRPQLYISRNNWPIETRPKALQGTNCSRRIASRLRDGVNHWYLTGLAQIHIHKSTMRSSMSFGKCVVVSAFSPAKSVLWTGGMRPFSLLWVRGTSRLRIIVGQRRR